MRKQRHHHRRLVLDKQTIRILGRAELIEAAGGLPPEPFETADCTGGGASVANSRCNTCSFGS